MYKFLKVTAIVVLCGVAFVSGSFIASRFMMPDGATKTNNLTSGESAKEKIKLTDAEVLGNINDRVNLQENLVFNDGQLKFFSISPVYKFVLEKKSELESGVTETIWAFEVGGVKKKFKTLSTRCTMKRDDTGEVVDIGEINAKEGQETFPAFAGLMQSLGTNIFSGKDELACQKVWARLQSYPQLKSEVRDFFTLGKIGSGLTSDKEGIVDLTDKLILYFAE